ncbi:hypothetical protein EIP91_010230 [Steccherinum ochraceum]|uniref:Uncharacterized protein n=1 Tax=Steccherinum ochraceum TaxID=92696 RepID=A0A4R0RD58_9APHY|nr:hypothetical protein EIP91_010230 [Steccherinum ochraceum]
MSHDEPASVAPVDLDLTSHLLPSPSEDEAPLPPSKRLRRDKQASLADSLHEQSPTSPESTWGYRSEASGSSSSSLSSYDRDSSSSGWSSDSTEMDYSPSALSFHDFRPPSSPRSKNSSLGLPPLPGLSTYSDTFLTDEFSPSNSSQLHSSSSGLLWFEPSHYDTEMSVDPPSLPPPSPRTQSLHIPSLADSELDMPFMDTIMPVEDEDELAPPAAPPPLGQLFHSLISTWMDNTFEVPSSPHSPHSDLPGLPEDEPYPTISPSLLSPAPETPDEGLGLFIQADPPLRRSPSPEDDALQFLDIQFDPTISHLDVNEFLALRSLRRRALDGERDAREREALLILNDRVAAASTALLPDALAEAGVLDDLQEKRVRKHELHVATDLRNEARKDRKREKQKSKEIGALLDIKMNGGGYSASGMGQAAFVDVRQLVASMTMRRREAARSLANRKSAAAHRPYLPSSLSSSVSVEDLREADI